MRYPLIHHLAGKACFWLCLIEIYTENMLMICATSVSTGGLWNMLDSTWNPLISHQSLCVLQTSNNSWTSPCKTTGLLKFGVKHGLQSALYDIAIAMFDHWTSFRFQGSTRRSPALGPFRRAKGDWEVRDPQGLSQASADGTSGPKPWGHDGPWPWWAMGGRPGIVPLLLLLLLLLLPLALLLLLLLFFVKCV